MANYLVTSPSSETVGTNSADLFRFETLQGVTTFGSDGADTISANVSASAATNVKINAGKGADTIFLGTAGASIGGSIFAGMGSDVISADGSLTAVTMRGGAGKDSIALSSVEISAVTLNGNDMADVISAGIGAASTKSFIGLGAGKDVLTAAFESGNADITIKGGLGHDVINVVGGNPGNASALIVEGNAGLDTIAFDRTGSNNLRGIFNIDGGDLGDRLTFAGGLSAANTTATIQGGAGADTILFSANYDLTAGLIGGGLGNDSIKFSALFEEGSLQGGAGVDSITLGIFGTANAADDQAGIIFGGAGADIIALATAQYSAASANATGFNGGSTLGYASFADSNISAFDTVSANVTFNSATGTESISANLFSITQDVVSARSAGAGLGNSNVTATEGIATFTSTFDNALTARVTELDKVYTQGTVIAFEDGSGNDYLFVQGGSSTGSGIDDDLLIKMNTAAQAITAAGSAIRVRVSAAFT